MGNKISDVSPKNNNEKKKKSKPARKLLINDMLLFLSGPPGTFWLF